MSKTVALYSPYIPKHAGGGERYLLSIAEEASTKHHVHLLVPKEKVDETQNVLSTYERTFGLDLSKVSVQPTIIGHGKNPFGILSHTRHFDILFAMTDGSIFPSLAKTSYLIMQVPWTRPLAFSEKLKLFFWKEIVVYSNFVKTVLERSWGVGNINVVAPYVDLSDFSFIPLKQKEQVIVSIGRFFAHKTSNSKRQDVLIDAFKKLFDHDVKTWRLVLIGNVDPNPDSEEFVAKLREEAKGYAIEILTNVSYEKVQEVCKKATLYWHAAGFEVDEEKTPEYTEHFGITTLEAMACGTIPLVVAKGGQKEIVTDSRFHWNSIEELVEKTHHLIQMREAELEDLSVKMANIAKRYSKEEFRKHVNALISV